MSNVIKVITYQPITIDNIKTSQFTKKGTLTAQIRQQVITKTSYPAVNTNDGVTSDIFAGEFENVGIGKEYSNTENRVAFITVPDTCTVQMLQNKLNGLVQAGKQPVIMKIVSNRPILTDNQKASIASQLKTMDDYANTQAIRFSKHNTEGNANKLILDDNQNVLYKRTFFQADKVADVNTCDPNDTYVSPQLEEEMKAVLITNSVLQDSNNGLF